MTIEKAWFFEYGMREGFGARTITNAIDPRFIATAKRYCNDEEEVYVDNCIEFQKKQLNDLRMIQEVKEAK